MAGRNLKISQMNSGLPQMTNALTGWEVAVVANYVKQEIIDGDIVDSSYTKKMQGVLQPLKAEQIALKPEGQRSWAWYWLHVKPQYDKLRTEQIVLINNIPYKVMAVKNYDIYGYIEYEVIRDYSNG